MRLFSERIISFLRPTSIQGVWISHWGKYGGHREEENLYETTVDKNIELVSFLELPCIPVAVYDFYFARSKLPNATLAWDRRSKGAC